MQKSIFLILMRGSSKVIDMADLRFRVRDIVHDPIVPIRGKPLARTDWWFVSNEEISNDPI